MADTCTWQLVMVGDGLHRITAEAQADMARLLDLNPAISHLTFEVGDASGHVAYKRDGKPPYPMTVDE